MPDCPFSRRRRIFLNLLGAALAFCPRDAVALESHEASLGKDGAVVLTYQATIASVDTVNSAGAALADVAGILQQDRFNVDVRGIRQGFDTPDAVFTDKVKRTALGRAEIAISPALQERVFAGGVSVQVEVREAGGDGRYRVAVTPAPIFEMPEAFRGRWAGSTTACAAGEALSILTMDATGLHQAEGAMVVKSLVVDPETPRRITLESDNAGGGETWVARHRVTLSRDGGRMAFEPLDAGAGPPFTLYRCG